MRKQNIRPFTRHGLLECAGLPKRRRRRSRYARPGTLLSSAQTEANRAAASNLSEPHVSEATQRAAELRGEITSKTTKQFSVLGLAAASASEGLTARGIVGSIHNEFQRIHLCMPQHSLGGRMERRAGQRPQPRGRTVDVVGRRCRN